MTTMTAHFGTVQAHAVASKLAAMLHALANMFEAKAAVAPVLENTSSKTATRRRLQGIASIYRMAAQYESSQPSLASELRSIAARG